MECRLCDELLDLVACEKAEIFVQLVIGATALDSVEERIGGFGKSGHCV